MIHAIHALTRIIRLGVFATALSLGSLHLPAPTLAGEENDTCFTDPAPACADTIMRRAVTLANAVADDKDRNRTLVALASLQSRLGDIAGARKSIDAIGDPADRKSAITHVLSNMAALSTADETLALAETYGGGWLTGHALYAISAELSGAGNVDAARKMTATIRQDDRRAKALEYIVGTQIASGDLAGARSIISDEQNDGIRSQLLLTLAGVHLGRSDFDSAFRLLEEITDKARQPLLAGFASALAQAGDLSSAVAMAFRITDKLDRDRALGDIAARLTFRRDFDGALAIAKEVAEEAIQNEIRVRVAAMRAEAAAFDLALSDARAIGDRAYREEALQKIAMTAVFRNDDSQLAMSVAAEILDETRKSEIVKALAINELRSGNEANALSIARGADNTSAQVMALLAIADARQRKALPSEDILLETETSIAGEQDQTVRENLLAEFSRTLAWMQFFQRATDSVQKIETALTRGKAKADIASSMAFFDLHERAAELLASIDNPEIRADAQQTLAMNAVTAGKTGAAMAYSKGLQDPGGRAIVLGFVAETLLRSPAR